MTVAVLIESLMVLLQFRICVLKVNISTIAFTGLIHFLFPELLIQCGAETTVRTSTQLMTALHVLLLQVFALFGLLFCSPCTVPKFSMRSL